MLDDGVGGEDEPEAGVGHPEAEIGLLADAGAAVALVDPADRSSTERRKDMLAPKQVVDGAPGRPGSAAKLPVMVPSGWSWPMASTPSSSSPGCRRIWRPPTAPTVGSS